MTLVGDTLCGNSLNGYGGGAIDNSGGTLTLDNCTLANNSSTGYGGAILNYGGTLYLNDDTIAYNGGANFGGAVFNGFGGVATLANTIVAGNTCSGYGIGPDVYGTIISKGFNLIGKTDGSSGWLATDLTGTAAVPLNANLSSALHNYGGPTRTLLPLAGSPAINAGSNALVPAGIHTDQRTLSRIMNGTVDIGAVEIQSPTATNISIGLRYGNELVITATGSNDTIQISQSGATLSILANGATFVESAPAAGIFVYTRGGKDFDHRQCLGERSNND